ncbi:MULTISPECIES: LysR family transcriptional regulator [Pseudomonadati]|uniref:LysR family transcriptional regulator n=1 Tax=Shewanella aestuarii TaxID=1028752 RepID=A0ABT0KZI3_9GAMM|nr:LysR family transcriptional regulator [Shewanella aestuarii]MCL1116868.1 LysR family transcriptional regulator [Shewanella aestuarii]GGN78650.1 LysR family transcriptional regulator [Shewanella aestuarii]
MDTQAIKKISELDVFCLLVFKTIYETGYANIAAKSLGVSAPKVSRCLTSLRNTFDDELFYRRQQGLKPTPLAEQLYQPICQFSDTIDQIESVAQQTKRNPLKPVLNVAVSPSIITSLAMSLSLPEFFNHFGPLRLHPWQNDTEEKIHKGEIDFGIGFDEQNQHGLNVTPIIEVSSLYVVANKDHPIWQCPSPISIEDIAEFDYVYLKCHGYNHRIDPLELYCQESGHFLTNIEYVSGLDDWYWHLMTMGSVSLTIMPEGLIANDIPRVCSQPLPTKELNKLKKVMNFPVYCFFEGDEQYRRYSEESKQIIITLINKLFLTVS